MEGLGHRFFSAEKTRDLIESDDSQSQKTRLAPSRSGFQVPPPKKEVITSLLFYPKLRRGRTWSRIIFWWKFARPHRVWWLRERRLGSRERTAITLLGLDSKIFRRKFLVWPPARLFFLLEKHDSAVQVLYASKEAVEGLGHRFFSAEKTRDPASRRRAPAFKSSP